MTISLADPAAPAAPAEPAAPASPASPETPPAAPDWFESLPPELKTDKSLQPFKGKAVGDVAKSYVEAQRLVGGSIRLPKPDAKPEERMKFTKDILGKLGAPDSPDKYTVTRPAIPENVPWDENAVKAFLPAAQALGLLPEQVQGVLNWYGAKTAEGYQTRSQEHETAEKALRVEWGGTFDYKLAMAKRYVMERGGPETMKDFEETGAGNRPNILRLLADAALLVAEKGYISGDVDGVPSRSAAQEKLDQIYADPTHPYHRSDPQAIEEVRTLTSLVVGNKIVAKTS